MPVYPRLEFAIDRGGTFTDVIALVTDAEGAAPRVVTEKLLSVDPSYPDAPSEGIRRVLRREVGEAAAPLDGPVPTGHVTTIRMGTTVATNALLERKGSPTVFVVTSGFEDTLAIGTQARPKLFDLDITRPAPLHAAVASVPERMVLEPAEVAAAEGRQRRCTVLRPLDEAAVRAALQRALDQGIRSAAVALVHSHIAPEHERRVGAIAEEMGFTHVTLSSALMALENFYPRAMTAVVNAYLSPVVVQYLATFKAQFEGGLQGVPLSFMQSDGGLCPADRFDAFRAVLSGPAGGVVGCAESALAAFPAAPMPAIGFDMGGTSTDVCRCDGTGTQEHVIEATVAGVPLQAPQVDVHTVAAGGGSLLLWKHGSFCVGPESAGAFPGPACYGRGGPLTVTDANAVLGYVQPEFFPRVFGADGRSPIDVGRARALFDALAVVIQRDTKAAAPMAPEAVALAFAVVADETMSRPVRTLTEGRGHRPADHALVCFGGAAGQHACRVARALQVKAVLVPRHSGLLSAAGIAAASNVSEVMRSLALTLPAGGASGADAVAAALADVEAEALGVARAQYGTAGAQWAVERFLSLRFHGTGAALLVPCPAVAVAPGVAPALPSAETVAGFVALFMAKHRQEFGFVFPDRDVCVDAARVRVVVAPPAASRDAVLAIADAAPAAAAVLDGTAGLPAAPTPVATVTATFDAAVGPLDVPVFRVGATAETYAVRGPALVLQNGATVVVDPHATAVVLAAGDVYIRTDAAPTALTAAVDPVGLALFGHRFMSIAERMGKALQRTAVSVNIKERLDFSCAIFDGSGRLVANAPHIPVHLGAMGATVRWQVEHWGPRWAADDVIVCNHPAYGGSHLPDITVIARCPAPDGAGSTDFYVAARGHHTDVGGSTPGSMPPFSQALEEEGVVIRAFKLVDGGVFDEAGITAVLTGAVSAAGPAVVDVPQSQRRQGTRALQDNLSDLKAQVAACRQGITLLTELCTHFGRDVVLAYMRHLQAHAADAVRTVLRETAARHAALAAEKGRAAAATGAVLLEAEDAMDDGTAVALRVELDVDSAAAVFDFTATGPQVLGGTNCPPAVVRSAVLYSLRCLLADDLPLNEGCLDPVTIRTRRGSLLQPAPDAAVVAGNVLTSQRITDVVLAAFDACANAQGDMNNITFGDGSFAYYETVCGGAGAGPGFHGASAVHTHMTNTRITDVEVLERRCPVLLRYFRIREGSGGRGKWRGGDGVERCLQLTRSVSASVLTERRCLAPNGLFGGGSGGRGANLLLRCPDGCDLPTAAAALNGAPEQPVAFVPEGGMSPEDDSLVGSGWRLVSLGAKAVVALTAGDALVVVTPGAGGFGQEEP